LHRIVGIQCNEGSAVLFFFRFPLKDGDPVLLFDQTLHLRVSTCSAIV
jgi:hypothetical protein